MEEKVEKAMAEFDFAGTGYCYDTTEEYRGGAAYVFQTIGDHG